MKIKGTATTGVKLWLNESGYWEDDERKGTEFCKYDADRRLRVINANNRFLDREDQIEAEIVESK